MIGCLWTCARKQPIIAVYFESKIASKPAFSKIQIFAKDQKQYQHHTNSTRYNEVSGLFLAVVSRDLFMIIFHDFHDYTTMYLYIMTSLKFPTTSFWKHFYSFCFQNIFLLDQTFSCFYPKEKCLYHIPLIKPWQR